MQPLKICIEGDFWDCQIYRGRLYIWTTDGDLCIYDWDHLIDSISESYEDKFPIELAFKRGDYLYGNQLGDLFSDTIFKQHLEERFKKYENQTFTIENNQLSRFELHKSENPFRDLPNDTEVYANNLYSVTDLGLSRINVHKSRNHFLGKRLIRLSDCPFLSIKVSKGRLALAGGEEGLFEFHASEDLNTDFVGETRVEQVDPKLFKLSSKHCSFANWSFASLYSSSHLDSSYLAAFDWKKREEDNDNAGHVRFLREIISQESIFNSNDGLSWGLQEKIYKANKHRRELDVIRYFQSRVGSERGDEPFERLGTIKFQDWKGNIIGGGISFFGIVIELEKALVVIKSDGNNITIPCEATQWRVYPRSIRYENHLHLIGENCLEIYSFNHDYFVAQDEKKAGIKYSPKNRHTSFR